jgi:hypothetical protein
MKDKNAKRIYEPEDVCPRCPECGRKLKHKQLVADGKFGAATVDEYAQALHELFNGRHVYDEPWVLHQPYDDFVVRAWRAAAEAAIEAVRATGVGSACW